MNKQKLTINAVTFEQRRSIAQWGLFGFFSSKSKPVEDVAAAAATAPPAPPVASIASEPVIPEVQTSGYIPEPPEIPTEELILTALGEPTLKSLGLASNYTPVGWIQSLLEFIHVDFGLPWYGTIIAYTIVLRIALIPLMIMNQRASAKMRIIMPQMTELNQKLTDAKARGNQMEVYKTMHEYTEFMRVSNFGIKTMLTPMAQVPFTIATFLAIRKMCNLPVESLFNGGALWFENLSLVDPYYVLPLVSCATIYIMLERGIEYGAGTAGMSHITKSFMRLSPLIMLPFFIYFPSGVMFYVCTTNLCSLIIAQVFYIDKVKKFCKIPIISPEVQKQLAEKKKKEPGFVKGFKESFSNSKLISEVEDREKYKMDQFEKAGLGAPLKTYKTNPKENKTKK